MDSFSYCLLERQNYLQVIKGVLESHLKALMARATSFQSMPILFALDEFAPVECAMVRMVLGAGIEVKEGRLLLQTQFSGCSVWYTKC